MGEACAGEGVSVYLGMVGIDDPGCCFSACSASECSLRLHPAAPGTLVRAAEAGGEHRLVGFQVGQAEPADRLEDTHRTGPDLQRFFVLRGDASHQLTLLIYHSL